MTTKGKRKASVPNAPCNLDELALLTHRDHFPKFYTQIVRREYPGKKNEKTPDEYTNMIHKLAGANNYEGFGFIDLFAGIGGFRLAGQKVGGRCLFTSEWDPYARKAYFINSIQFLIAYNLSIIAIFEYIIYII